MLIDIVICTYNRSDKVNFLVLSILKIKEGFNKIIVIDSSDIDNDFLKSENEVLYTKSNHKNQPYQRYVGFLLAQSEYILFLDDDMELVHNRVFEVLNEVINLLKFPSGLALNFKDKFSNPSLSSFTEKSLFNKKSYYMRFLHFFTRFHPVPHNPQKWI
jgi:glycosyltransferase involved in cell wall biosynthesis